MSSAVSQFELRPDELKLDDLYNWLCAKKYGEKNVKYQSAVDEFMQFEITSASFMAKS